MRLDISYRVWYIVVNYKVRGGLIMAKTEAKKRRKRVAPYAPAGTLSQFFDHIRYVKTPEVVTSGLLEDYNIPKGHAFALLSALKFLGLTEDDGTPTPAYKALQTSGEEFRVNLEEIVRRAYGDLFSVVDPARNGREHIKNFFARNHSPATAERATALFLDLCGEAKIPTLEEKPVAITKGKSAPSKPKMRAITTEVSEEPEVKRALSENDLKNIYLKKLIEQISPPDTSGKDAEAIKAEAELRRVELDRIEKLIGITKEKEEKKE